MQYSNLVFFAVLAGVFWFLIIRPQQQRQKQQREMLEALAPGDEIVTIGGIYATVLEVGERVRVSVASGAELEVAKQAIANLVSGRSGLVDEEATVATGDQPEHETERDADA